MGGSIFNIVSVQLAKRDSIGIDTEKSSLELRLAFRNRRGLCGSETWGKCSKRKRLLGSLKADQVVCFSRKESATEWEQHIVLPVQGMFKVTVYCRNIVFMPLLLVTSLPIGYAPVLLKHDTLSFGFIPKRKT